MRLGLFSALLLGLITESLAFSRPIYLGPGEKEYVARDSVPISTLSYMRADQMAQKVRSLTGFYETGFDEFAFILGTIDPKTGTLTNDRPTVVSVIVLEKLTAEVANAVLEREIFLDDADRVVFTGFDLSVSPDEKALQAELDRLCLAFFAQTCAPVSSLAWREDFRATEKSSGGSMKAWTQLLGKLLQDGTLYYY